MCLDAWGLVDAGERMPVKKNEVKKRLPEKWSRKFLDSVPKSGTCQLALTSWQTTIIGG